MTTISPISISKNRLPLAWAIFLATSWTWCIGMFLPVLLVRDLGFWGFVVFAVPNIAGAAAMGFVLPWGKSEAIVQRCRISCIIFSIVTILFHLFFAAWIISALLGIGGALLTIFLAGIFARLARWEVRISILVYLASLIMIGLFFIYSHPALPPTRMILPHADVKLLCLVPISLFGFGLCPYLDLTFHRARQSMTRDGAKIAFGVGFGLFFVVMILFTLAYSGHLVAVLGGISVGIISILIGVHMLIQTAFTIAAHWKEIIPIQNAGNSVLMVVLLCIITSIMIWATRQGFWPAEIVYLIFMSFYGLVFPAYVVVSIITRSTPLPLR